jgi:hypothetical protein
MTPAMKLTPLCDFDLRHTDLEVLDYDVGGQLYGPLECPLVGERFRGDLRMTNMASKRPDDVNLPTVRGLLTTDDGAKVWRVMDGIALARPTDDARVVTAAVTFRTGDSRYTWLNTVFAVTEVTLGTVATGGVVRHRDYHCEPTIGTTD